MDESPHITDSASPKSSLPMGMIAIALIVLVGVGALGYKLMASKNTPESTSIALTDTVTNPEVKSMTTTDPMYKNGSYDALGTYTSPAGPEEIDVKLTITDNVVTEAQVTPKATAPKSQFMQKAFESGYKEMVIGKKLNDIKLDKVSGSSLTPMGFNAAVEIIKTKAAISSS